jgi:hypothetical protein
MWGKKKTKHSDDCADAKEYYYKVLEAKKAGEEWAKNIPLDMNVFHGDCNEVEHLRGPYDKDAKPRTREEVLGSIKTKRME